MLFPPIGPGVFFRPEETTFLSKGLDDVGVLQTAEIHVGDKDNRMVLRFRAAAIHVTVDLHLQGSFTAGFLFNFLYSILNSS